MLHKHVGDRYRRGNFVKLPFGRKHRFRCLTRTIFNWWLLSGYVFFIIFSLHYLLPSRNEKIDKNAANTINNDNASKNQNPFTLQKLFLQAEKQRATAKTLAAEGIEEKQQQQQKSIGNTAGASAGAGAATAAATAKSIEKQIEQKNDPTDATNAHPVKIANEKSNNQEYELVFNTATTKHFPTVYVYEYGAGQQYHERACDVPCQWTQTRSTSIYHVEVEKKEYSVLSSMEGPQYLPLIREKGKHDALSTTSFQSEIPKPYIGNRTAIQVQPINATKVIQGSSFIARNCASKNNRERWIKKLQSYTRVDSISSCLNNAPWPTDVTRTGNGDWGMAKLLVMKKYMFHLAFENQCEDDYITEKLWISLQAGTLPVYFGAPNIRDHVPDKSIIIVDDFDGPEALAAHLNMLMKNKTAYDEYHAWRFKPLPKWWMDKYEFVETHSQCRTCRWAYAKFHGLPWNRATQTFGTVEKHLPHDKVRSTIVIGGNSG